MIVVDSRRRSSAVLERRHPGAAILDVTSRGPQPWVRFSPFFPHGGIPVPHVPGLVGSSVEGIWQAFKVFEKADIDLTRLTTTTMRGLKRTERANGPVLGHRAGLDSSQLLDYLDARRRIYLPAYRWCLEQRLGFELGQLRALAEDSAVVLLDYNVNGDVDDLSRPLSHAHLIADYLEDRWPVPSS